MAFLYQDPWKDDPYGKCKGDKSTDYFEISFDEAKIHPIENGYILAAYVTSYSGVLRSFKPEQAIEPGLCAIPFYSGDFELRAKVNGEYVTTKYQPSKFEKAICQRIKENEANLVGDGKFVKGKIIHPPNGMVANYTDETIKPMVDNNLTLEIIPSVTKLKDYVPYENKQQRKGGSWGAKSPSMDEKLAFIKGQLLKDVKSPAATAETELGDLVDAFHKEHAHEEAYLTIYFDILIATIR